MGIMYLLKESVSPGTPAANYVGLYMKTDGTWYYKDDSGVERVLFTSGSATASGLFYGAALNGYFDWSVAGNALTVAAKAASGSDPSGSDVLTTLIRNATASIGSMSRLDVVAASSVVAPSGATFGTRSGVPFRLWVVAFNDAGTWRLGIINCLTTVAGTVGSDVTALYPLGAWGIASSTAIGAGSTSAQTFYTGSAVTSKPYITLGYATWETGLATAGTWNATPTRIQLFGSGVPLPGQVVQIQRNATGTSATGTTTIPADNTIPQSTEGDQYLSQAITPSSAANVLTMRSQVVIANDAVGTFGLIAALFQDATANALCATEESKAQSNIGRLTIDHSMLAATASSTTLKVRAGCNAAGTSTFNGVAGGQHMGGVMCSFLEVAELMA